MTKLVGLSGSLRRESFNSSLLRAAAGLMPDGAELAIETIEGIPLYNADVETDQGVPEKVEVVKDAVAAADGFLLVTPEYNNSIPGPLKNAIDWLSRPADDIERVFVGRPVALIGASPGSFGTVLAQDAWLPVFRTLKMEFWSEGRLMISRAGDVFDDSGALADDKLERRLETFLAGFVAFCRRTLSA